MQGMGVSPGISIGRAFVVRDRAVVRTGIRLESEMAIGEEVEKYYTAIRHSTEEIRMIMEEMKEEGGSSQEGVDILETHIELLSDPQLEEEVLKKIRTEKKNAGDAVLDVIDSFVQVFKNMEDDYLRERAADVQDIGNRILRHLQGAGADRLAAGLGEEVAAAELPAEANEGPANIILIAEDLSPSDTLTLDLGKVGGFITRAGGQTSHAAIIARSRGIPAVVGCGSALKDIRDNDLLVLDGRAGLVLVNPTAGVLQEYKARRAEHIKKISLLQSLKNIPAITTDGVRIKLLANIATEEDLAAALEQGAEGVGLLRTELLFMGRESLPTESEQFIFYRQIAIRAGHYPVTIRTLDIGGDKPLSYLHLPEEKNPFLGYRAIRISLDRSDLFLTQLRAILRASAFGKLKILFPMISHVQQVRTAMAFLNQAKNELLQQGVAFDTDIAAGIMIEIPSAAITADLLAKEVDFFSIGTNDLCQYALAVDRMNEKIEDLYDPFHPGVLRLIQYTVRQAQKNNLPVSLCGELAADPLAVLWLIGMGLGELSMNSPSIPVIKNIILHTSRTEAQSVCKKIMEGDL